MPLVVPRHSKEQNCEVYHNHSDCTESNNIEERNFVFGIGGKRLCKHCEKLADSDAMAEKMLKSKSSAAVVHALFGARNKSIFNYIAKKQGK